jgi:signal transduction histidine kinase
VTERRQSEAQAAELSAKERAVGVLRTLIDYVSHDFRTPLSVVNAYLFLIRRKLHDEALVRSYLDILDQQAARLAEIVDDITTVSNLNYEAERFVFSLVDLNVVLCEVLNNQEAAAVAKRVTMQSQLAETLPMVRGDAVWLTRMVKNLLVNALQHTGADGQITVRTTATTDHVVLEVGDTGAGIAAADLPYIFDYFYRGDKTRPMHTGGAGLGLTIVQKIVEAHHGAIEVVSSLGQGSTFRIHLPRL